MRDFGTAAHEARERIEGESLRADEVERLRRSLFGTTRAVARSSAWRWTLGLAVGAAMVLALSLGVAWFHRQSVDAAGFQIITGRACLVEIPRGARADPNRPQPLVLDIGGAEATLAAGSELQRDGTGVRVSGGRVGFAVVKRSPREPAFSVAVSAGTVLVTGTRFLVEEHAGVGMITVDEGSVDFRWADGHGTDHLSQGDSLSWPRQAAVAPEPTGPSLLPEQAPRARPSPPTNPDKIMQQMFQLRSQGKFAEAVHLLEGASRDPRFATEQRERFSFELGDVVAETQGPEIACAHWQAHQKAFPKSVHAARIRELLSHCK